MRSPPKPLVVSTPTAVWGAVACLVAVSAVEYVLVSGAEVQAKLERLAVERHDHARRERRLFWRTLAISAFIALVVIARMLAG